MDPEYTKNYSDFKNSLLNTEQFKGINMDYLFFDADLKMQVGQEVTFII